MKKLIAYLTILVGLNSCNTNYQQTSVSTNQDLVNQYFAYFNKHDWEKMAAMYSETAAFKDPSLGKGIVSQTREQTVEKYRQLNAIFPDLKDQVEQIYEAGNENVVVEFVSSGTAPDGSKFELPICTIFTISDGKIIKDFTYYDNFEE